MNSCTMTVLLVTLAGSTASAFAIEDCDGNGIADAIDIAAGRLVDADGNGRPDCCERGYPCAVNLIQNGGFESGQAQDCGWVLLQPNASTLPSWQVMYGSVDRVRLSATCPQTESWRSFQGEFTIDLSGQQSGRIQQSVSTRPGHRYVLSLATSTNNGWQSTGARSMRLQAGPLETTVTQPLTPYPAQWIVRSFEFVANAAVTTVALSDQSGVATVGMVIDDVRLVPFGTYDCNGDGRYDLEQIISGELSDTNNNGIPDSSLTITAQPTDQAASAGAMVAFRVEVASTEAGCDTAPTFQWQRRNPLVPDPQAADAWLDIIDGRDFVNANTSSLGISSPTPGLATGYRCRITGGCGCEPLYTQTVNFNVACPADFNADGGIDFGDVEAFFERWENGC